MNTERGWATALLCNCCATSHCTAPYLTSAPHDIHVNEEVGPAPVIDLQQQAQCSR
jgi:hypothetical protein